MLAEGVLKALVDGASLGVYERLAFARFEVVSQKKLFLVHWRIQLALYLK